MILLDKSKLLKIFEEVLTNWESAQEYVLQDTICVGEDHLYEELIQDIKNYRKQFVEVLNS